MCGRRGWAVGSVEHVGTCWWGAVAHWWGLECVVGKGRRAWSGLGMHGWVLGGIAAKLEYPALSSRGLTPGIQKPTRYQDGALNGLCMHHARTMGGMKPEATPSPPQSIRAHPLT